MDLLLRQGAWMNWRMIFRSRKEDMKMKNFYLLVAVFLLLTGSMDSFADPVKDDMAERIRLSKDLHDIRHMGDRIREMIDLAAAAVPPEDRVDFERYVQLKIDVDGLESKSIQYAAEVYTAPELKAMIRYFGSPDGQSAEAKGETFTNKIGQEITKEIDAAILAAKYDGVPEKSLPKIKGE